MTTSNHTPIATGAAANASTFNTPLGSLDAAIGDETTLTTTVKTSVVAAINELDAGKLESGASAALIANTPAGNIAATNVQTAINELDTEKQPLDADLTAIAAISPSNDDVIQRKSGAWTNRTMAELKTDLALTAANVANVAAGTIAAVTVQAAIDELDTEKAAASHTHTVSQVTDQSNWKLDNFGTADDNTDLNATTTQHGLLAKLSGAAGYFMDGLGAWARAFVSIMWSGSGNFQAKYINFKGSAVTGVSYNAVLDSVDVTITGGSGAGATLLTELTDVSVASPPDDNDVLSYDTTSSKWVNVAAGAGHTIQDEGVNLTNRNTLNFVGTGVTVADVSLKTTVTIPRYDDGWIPASGTWQYASTSTITVPSGAAAIYSVGDKIRFQNNDSGTYLYACIKTVADTLLTLNTVNVPNAVITDNYYSKSKTPLAYPYNSFVGARAYLASTLGTTVDAAYTKIMLDTEDYDIGGNFASSTFTCPVGGYYLVTGAITGGAIPSDKRIVCVIYLNGTITRSVSAANGGVSSDNVAYTGILYCPIGATIELYYYYATGTTTSDITGGISNTCLEVTLLVEG